MFTFFAPPLSRRPRSTSPPPPKNTPHSRSIPFHSPLSTCSIALRFTLQTPQPQTQPPALGSSAGGLRVPFGCEHGVEEARGHQGVHACLCLMEIIIVALRCVCPLGHGAWTNTQTRTEQIKEAIHSAVGCMCVCHVKRVSVALTHRTRPGGPRCGRRRGGRRSPLPCGWWPRCDGFVVCVWCF